MNALQAAAAIVLGLGIGLMTAAIAQDQASSISHVRNNGWRSAAVTPSDSTKITVTSALFVGAAAACNINMLLNGDTVAVLWSNVQPGEILPVQAVLVKSSSTTCTGIVALYDR